MRTPGMRGRARRTLVAVAWMACVAVLCAWPAAARKDKVRKVDHIWVHPDYDSLRVESIALLPATSYDNNREHEKIVEGMLGQALRPSGYRWVSPLVAREMVKSMLGDSTLVLLGRGILEHGRVDSLLAPRVCRAIRADAVMAARIELFEQIQLEWNQSGRPSTTVQIRAALVDSAGRLLWLASGSETAEGHFRDPEGGTMGVRGSGLGKSPVMVGQSGPPSYDEVTTRLFTRWMQHFPAKEPESAAAP